MLPSHLPHAGPSTASSSSTTSSSPRLPRTNSSLSGMKSAKGSFEHREYRSQGISVAVPSDGPNASRPSYTRAPSTLRQSSSADDLDVNNQDDSSTHPSWTDAHSPTDSSSPTDSNPSTCASTSSDDSDLDFDVEPSPPRITVHPASPALAPTQPPSPSSTKQPLQTQSLQSHPYRRPRMGLTPMSSLPAPPATNGNGVLPKSQPLARTLFARMADAPHAGMGLGFGMGMGMGLGCGAKKTGGKQKMIVATKPMRTTFELGLTASELARRA